jgi:FkbM family methyltransferase|tara:strand:- start:10434 stop:11099 length:666 start_codon:yes stop_codon:yes gene_type:complete
MGLNIKKNLPRLLGKHPTILEIGANVGRDTNRFLSTFQDLDLYCFEPDPRCLDRFKTKVLPRDRVHLFEVAISDCDGHADFYLSSGRRHSSRHFDRIPVEDSPGHINSSSLLNPTGHLKEFPWCKFEETIRVETKRLDTWASENNIEMIDFIWADVQGAEKKMIKGGFETLARARYLYTEYSNKQLYQGQPTLKNILKLLSDFTIQQDFKKNVLLRNRLFG